MSDYVSDMTKAAGGQLEPGEVLVIGTKCLPGGKTKARAIGGLAGGALSKKHTVNGEKLPSAIVLGLSQRPGRTGRLWVFSGSAMSGKANKVFDVLDLAEVATVDGDKSHLMGMKKFDIVVTLTSGESFAVEVPRAMYAKGEAFAEALIAATAGPASGTPPAPAPPPPPPSA